VEPGGAVVDVQRRFKAEINEEIVAQGASREP